MVGSANCLEDWDVLRHLGLLSLHNTLGNPNNVADLLLLQLEVRVKHAVAELLHEAEFVQLHFVLEESLFQTLVFRVLNIGQQVAVSLRCATVRSCHASETR